MRFIAGLLLHALVFIIKYPLSPIAVWFFSTPDKKHLTRFNWLETLDADLSGDFGWRLHLAQTNSNPYSDYSRIRWLWRNGGNAINYQVLGCVYDEIFAKNHRPEPYPSLTMKSFFKRPDGFWSLRKFIVLPTVLKKLLKNDYLEIFWGWHLFYGVAGKCKYVFTTRLRSDVN